MDCLADAIEKIIKKKHHLEITTDHNKNPDTYPKGKLAAYDECLALLRNTKEYQDQIMKE